MQIKVVIGTIAFMLAMIIVGYAAIFESNRMERFSDAAVGRNIEQGAYLYYGNCSTCHGETGKAEECYDTEGNQIGCVGLPLNNPSLLCEDNTQRMETLNWTGSKTTFIESTVASGRPGTEMPAWSSNFGGPMRDDQVRNVAAFVLNFETEELCAAPVVTYEWQETYEEFREEFPDADPDLGSELYVSPYGCSGCHGTMDGTVAAAVGPALSNISKDGADRVEGYSAEDYIYESILDPSAYIVEECPFAPCAGPPSAMAANNFHLRFGENPQDLADLIEYLMTFNE